MIEKGRASVLPFSLEIHVHFSPNWTCAARHFCLFLSMSDAEFNLKYSLLPPEMKQQVLDFISYLYSKKPEKGNSTEQKPLKKREFGCEKGSYYMADDFDAPLEDFKDYM